MTVSHLSHRFETSFPDRLEPGILYISLKYDTTAHLCACGCGNPVLLPLHPTGWRFTYDGTDVSLSPSVGNWSFPCRSHYWIDHGHVRWSSTWTDAQVQAGRECAVRERTGKVGQVAAADVPSAASSWQTRALNAWRGLARRLGVGRSR